MFSIIGFTVEALVTIVTGVGRLTFKFVTEMFSLVMLLYVVFSVKVFDAYFIGKAGGLSMSGFLVPPRSFLERENFVTNAAHDSHWVSWDMVPPIS